MQFVHFAEENARDFASEFPALYPGTPYGVDTFVTFNMASYALFTLASIALWGFGSRKLVVPLLFFCVNGTFGNAIAHSLWVLPVGGYFPGWFSSLPYWILGPILAYRISATIFEPPSPM